MPRLEIPVGMSRGSSFRSGGMWVGRHFPLSPAASAGGTQDVMMRPEPSSHSKSLPSSPPSLSCCLLHTGTLWNIRPSSNHWGNLRVPPAAAPSPQGQHPQEQSTGWIQESSQAGSEGTAGSGCVRRLRRNSLLRVIITRGPASLNHRALRRAPTTPRACPGVLGHR